MTILFLGALGLLGGMWFLAWYKRASPPQRRRALRNLLIYGIAAALLVMVLTGRIHLLFAAIPALLVWANRLWTAHSAWRSFKRFRQGGSGGGRAATDAMSVDEAREILGVAAGATREEIIEAHRKLMLKVHPDRGGSDYLASQINRAKEVLLEKV